MIDALAIAGYSDATEYIDLFTRHWPFRYGVKVHAYPFGASDSAKSYAEQWQNFERALENLGKVSIIGISFGFSIAMRAKLEHPNNVGTIVGISAPHNIEDMDQTKVEHKYPKLKPALEAVDFTQLPPEDVLTIRPFYDSTVNPAAVIIPGARNETVPAGTHVGGIGLALILKATTIANFLKEGMAT